MLLTFSTDIMLDKKALHIVGLNTLTKLKALPELFLSISWTSTQAMWEEGGANIWKCFSV